MDAALRPEEAERLTAVLRPLGKVRARRASRGHSCSAEKPSGEPKRGLLDRVDCSDALSRRLHAKSSFALIPLGLSQGGCRACGLSLTPSPQSTVTAAVFAVTLVSGSSRFGLCLGLPDKRDRVKGG